MAMASDEVARNRAAEQLSTGRRRERQESAHLLALVAREDPEFVAEVAGSLVAALSLPEAQTRWKCLDALTSIVEVRPDLVPEAFEGAEEALFDEGSASLRLAAFKFLSRYGALGEDESKRAWPLMSEAIQCYHGDPEYREMLASLMAFVRGQIADDVRDLVVARMEFDAKNARGLTKAYSKEISAAAREA